MSTYQKSAHHFRSLALLPSLQKAIEQRGYTHLTPIQSRLISSIFKGGDVVAGASTGTGKTAGFLLPILDQLERGFVEGRHYPKALIVAPTAELARQIEGALGAYGKYLSLRSVLLVGGANFQRELSEIAQGVDVVVSTVGRLLDHMERKTLNLEALCYLVLDEADTLFDMGFIGDIARLMQRLPQKRQSIFVSATLSTRLKRFAQEVLHRPMIVEVDAIGGVASTIEQRVYRVEATQKLELLSYLIGSRNYRQLIVFVRKRALADEVADFLNGYALNALAMHGQKRRGERQRTLKRFVDGEVRVLVATDIAARGLDIPSLPLVINYDTPHVIEDYIHRIGRTGRAGAKGLAITLLSPLEQRAFEAIERLMGQEIAKQTIEGYEPKPLAPMPKGSRSTPKEIKKTAGAFGKRRSKEAKASQKRRKTTKRDGFKMQDRDHKGQKEPRRGRKRR
jgi:ATP-dependent RNA helicase RhlE